jgi:hypothetical protein
MSMALLRTLLVALPVATAPAIAQAQNGPFIPTDIGFDEAWKYACWDKATIQYVANDCLSGGRYAMSGKYSRWTAEWMKEVDAAVPAKIAEVRALRANFAARQNMAYRTLRGRNVSHDDAVVICRDSKSVDAIIDSVAGLVPAPNMVIENRGR